MKLPILSILCVSIMVTSLCAKNPAIEISITPAWQLLDTQQHATQECGGPWILACDIEIKKKTTQEIKVRSLTFSWHGQYLESLFGSLYKGRPLRNFILLQKNLVCDGAWHKAKQQLILSFEEPVTLDSDTKLHLVLTIPPTIKPIIKSGFFKLEHTGLPEIIRSHEKPSLTLAGSGIISVKDQDSVSHF